MIRRCSPPAPASALIGAFARACPWGGLISGRRRVTSSKDRWGQLTAEAVFESVPLWATPADGTDTARRHEASDPSNILKRFGHTERQAARVRVFGSTKALKTVRAAALLHCSNLFLSSWLALCSCFEHLI